MQLEENPTEDPTHAFHVSSGERTCEVIGRGEAVAVARAWMHETRGRVCVERDDGRILMEYRNGGLESYVHETRRRVAR